ncbi:MAG TPA: biotin--[acetyl-CoA-carboxylase] ligase [Solirubrobacteraceae bacterium]|jgi:BirA family biotin operon repressor/biotin-[acetyl-CoA-carboxylase] ligase
MNAEGSHASTLGRPRVHRRVTGSTSVDARELAVAGAPHGTLVTALEQTDGRGRQGRRWHAPAGSALLCSLVLRDPPRLLPIAAGVAVAELAGPAAMLKWPNDVLLDGRKVAGILIEGRPQEGWAVLGIGVNVAVTLDDLPAELSGSAGTLGLGADAVEPSLTRLVELLERWLAAPLDETLAAWRARDALLGAPLRWRDGTGSGAGIDDDGRLLVAIEDGRQVALDAGEVHLETPSS